MVLLRNVSHSPIHVPVEERFVQYTASPSAQSEGAHFSSSHQVFDSGEESLFELAHILESIELLAFLSNYHSVRGK